MGGLSEEETPSFTLNIDKPRGYNCKLAFGAVYYRESIDWTILRPCNRDRKAIDASKVSDFEETTRNHGTNAISSAASVEDV